MKKQFELRVLLTVTTDRLLTKGKGERDNGIGYLYDILGHMTGDSPFTHQLPRFADECKPVLLEDFPELANADTTHLDRLIKERGAEAGIEVFLGLCEQEWGMKGEYMVGQITDHKSVNPIEELYSMLGGGEQK